VITVRRVYDDPLHFADASRISTDDHNNLEIWAGADGDVLLYVCAATQWFDVTIEGETNGSD
jgi:hypothetical protein